MPGSNSNLSTVDEQ
jgi:hypothetical protein